MSAPSSNMAEQYLYGCSQVSGYDVQEKLGEGTFGHVFRALHKSTSSSVALKQILLHNKEDGMPITALREIKILKRLEHENIIELLDMVVARGSRSQRRRAEFFMATPYMDHDLSGLLQNPKVRFTLPHIKCYMEQLLAGMGYLHDQHYMHRDIKAANILVDNRGVLKLADFGLARYYDEKPPTVEGTSPAQRKYTPTVVTRWYRPPELLLGELKYTPAVDMWGVGCVFAEIFMRKPVFQGKSDRAQIMTVFKVTGMPSEESMPGFTQLPAVQAGVLNEETATKTFDEYFNIIPQQGRELLSEFLILDPLKRLTAHGALQHAFFKTAPTAADRNSLPIYTSSHEMAARQLRKERENAANNGNSNLPESVPQRPSWSNNRDFQPGGSEAERVNFCNVHLDRQFDPVRRYPALGYKSHNRPLPPAQCVPPYRRLEANGVNPHVNSLPETPNTRKAPSSDSAANVAKRAAPESEAAPLADTAHERKKPRQVTPLDY